MSDSDTIVMRDLDKSDIDRVLDFHAANGGDRKTAEEWSWEYWGCHPDRYQYAIAERNGEVIGTQGMIPVVLQTGTDEFFSVKSEDSLVAPDVRGSSFFTDLYTNTIDRCRQSGIECIWGFTPAVNVWREKLGFTVHENYLYYSVRTVHLRGALRKFVGNSWPFWKTAIMSGMAIGSYFFSSCAEMLKRIPGFGKNRGYVIESTPRRPDDVCGLYDRIRRQYPRIVHIRQDEQYISWRIEQNPRIRYHRWYCYEDDDLKGYCYTGLNEADDQMLFISDILFEDDRAGDELIRTITRHCRKNRIGVLYFFGNIGNPLVASVFRRLGRFGFVKKCHPMAFVIKPLSPDRDGLDAVENWYATGLWTEGYTM